MSEALWPVAVESELMRLRRSSMSAPLRPAWIPRRVSRVSKASTSRVAMTSPAMPPNPAIDFNVSNPPRSALLISRLTPWPHFWNRFRDWPSARSRPAVSPVIRAFASRLPRATWTPRGQSPALHHAIGLLSRRHGSVAVEHLAPEQEPQADLHVRQLPGRLPEVSR